MTLPAINLSAVSGQPLPPVAEWTLEDAKGAVQRTLHQDVGINRALVEDKDFWQKGDLWPGHRTGDSKLDDALLANIQKQFCIDDLITECFDNYVNGLLGTEAAISLDPMTPLPDDATDEQKQELEDDQQARLRSLSLWWDRKGFWRAVKQTIRRTRYAMLREQPNVGRGTMRFRANPGRLVARPAANGQPATTNLPTGLSFDEALDVMEVEDVRPDAAAVYTDPMTSERAGVVLTRTSDNVEQVELWRVEGAGAQARTTMRLLSTGNTKAQAAPVLATLDLGGKLPVLQAEGDAVLTGPLRTIQSVINFIATVLPRTVEHAGFKQRYITNAEPPGVWYPFPPQNGPALAEEEIDGKKYYKHVVPWVLGASVTAEVVGVRSVDPTTKQEQFATPGVTIEEPTDPAFVTNALERMEAVFYRRMKQGHLANTATAQLSGEAYQQARAAFAADLENGRGSVETLLRDALEVLLRYAALMSAEAAQLLQRYRIVVNLHPHAGPVTPDELNAVASLRTAGLISRETAMARVGVEDTVADVQAMDEDPVQLAELSLKRANAAEVWLRVGASAKVAAMLAGVPESEANLLETQGGVSPPPTPGPARPAVPPGPQRVPPDDQLPEPQERPAA